MSNQQGRRANVNESMNDQPKHRWTAIRIVVSIVIALGLMLFVLAHVLARQTGFEGKTLWDWMNLALTPAVLAGLAGFAIWWLDKKRTETEQALAKAQAETERALALDRTQEDRLQVYIDRMQDLLEKGVKSQSPESDILRDVARTRTLTVLRSLDGERAGRLMFFLSESELVTGASPAISLRGANLIGAKLSHADLRGADLSGADLSEASLDGADLRGAKLNDADLTKTEFAGANLSGAKLNVAYLSEAWMLGSNLSKTELRRAYLGEASLVGADFGEADLSEADLNNATLCNANLSGVNLRGADLRGVNLAGANLCGADLSGANLNRAGLWGMNDADLRVAAIYDDRTKWPDGFDPIAAHAEKVESETSNEVKADEGYPV